MQQQKIRFGIQWIHGGREGKKRRWREEGSGREEGREEGIQSGRGREERSKEGSGGEEGSMR